MHACTDISIFTCTTATQKRPPLGLEHSATAQPREYSIYKHLGQVEWRSLWEKKREKKAGKNVGGREGQY